ncbi:hypothetical protein SLS53_002786 [Cytospora paraplurivora]|uniref:Uncharacterized protein n=1 Tax=Cytospora paraplurivora TaxID=2898453 RepID=A0AAN9UBS6_9PEZI
MSIMMNLTSQLPVSPPPDHKQLFNQYPTQNPKTVPGLAHGFANPLLYKQLAMQMEAHAAKKEPTPLEKHLLEQQQQQLLLQKMKQEAIQQARKQQQQQQQQQQSQQQPQRTSSPQQQQPDAHSPTPSANTSNADTKVPSPASSQLPQSQQIPSSPNHLNFNLFNTGGDPTASVDPKYVQMVSRMAAYYQQRCQAILNFQQQRCQTWANTHRQKCQEMMQAAMLVVAWYIRDRIGRRRRRQKRTFRRGLREKNSVSAARRVPKGETIRKWVLGIPEAALSPNNGIRDESILDKEELAFDVEKEVIPEKDHQLFAVADQMIKSQMAKIDVPLLGALNMDESDSESESDDDDVPDARYYYEDEEFEEEEEDGEIDDDDLEYDDETEEYVEDEISQEALHGTGKGSSKRKRSESDIDTEQVGPIVPQAKRTHKA